MKNSEIKLTCGMTIKEAREKKGYTVNDLAFEISKTKEIEEVKQCEKKIISWEKDKAYPNLEEVYLLAYALDELDPTKLMILRDRHRKNIKKTTNKRKLKKINWDKIEENLSYVVIACGKLFLFFMIIVFAIFYAKAIDVGVNGPNGAEGFDAEVRKLCRRYFGILQCNN